MMAKVKYLVIVFIVLGLVQMSLTAFAATTIKDSLCSNPIKETIDSTPSIKAMQSRPAGSVAYKYDVLGRRVPTQTLDSGTWQN